MNRTGQMWSRRGTRRLVLITGPARASTLVMTNGVTTTCWIHPAVLVKGYHPECDGMLYDLCEAPDFEERYQLIE